MKKIKIGLPAVALIVAITTSAFTLPDKKPTVATTSYYYTFLQQDEGGTTLLVPGDPAPNWVDVTVAVDNDPVLYSDEPAHCILSDEATCVVQIYEGGDVIQAYDGLSQEF